MVEPITIKLLVAVVMIALVIGLVQAREPAIVEQCMDDEQRERVRGIVLEGIEGALKDQVKNVFDMWMRDSTEQPKRAITGMHIGINAYVRSRAQALKWNPPKCEEGKK